MDENAPICYTGIDGVFYYITVSTVKNELLGGY